MATPVSVTIPHRLTKEQARSRLVNGIADFKTRFGQNIASVQDTWTQDHLDFQFTAFSQTVTGRLDVTDKDVRVEVDLPWILAALAGKIRSGIEQQGQKLLEQKKA